MFIAVMVNIIVILTITSIIEHIFKGIMELATFNLVLLAINIIVILTAADIIITAYYLSLPDFPIYCSFIIARPVNSQYIFPTALRFSFAL